MAVGNTQSSFPVHLGSAVGSCRITPPRLSRCSTGEMTPGRGSLGSLHPHIRVTQATPGRVICSLWIQLYNWKFRLSLSWRGWESSSPWRETGFSLHYFLRSSHSHWSLRTHWKESEEMRAVGERHQVDGGRWTGFWLLTLMFQRYTEADRCAVCCRWVDAPPVACIPFLPLLRSHWPPRPPCPSLCPRSCARHRALLPLFSEVRVRTVECGQELISKFKGRSHIGLFLNFFLWKLSKVYKTRRGWIALCSSSSLNVVDRQSYFLFHPLVHPPLPLSPLGLFWSKSQVSYHFINKYFS